MANHIPSSKIIRLSGWALIGTIVGVLVLIYAVAQSQMIVLAIGFCTISLAFLAFRFAIVHWEMELSGRRTTAG